MGRSPSIHPPNPPPGKSNSLSRGTGAGQEEEEELEEDEDQEGGNLVVAYRQTALLSSAFPYELEITEKAPEDKMASLPPTSTSIILAHQNFKSFSSQTVSVAIRTDDDGSLMQKHLHHQGPVLVIPLCQRVSGGREKEEGGVHSGNLGRGEGGGAGVLNIP